MDTQYLQLPEGSIAYDSRGSGPLVICVPGMGDVREQFRFLAPQLAAAGFRAVTMDLRGHGETSVSWQEYSIAGVGRDILALIRRLDAGPAVVIGNSMAAGSAVWAAVEDPELISTLGLIGPALHGELSWSYRLLLNVLFARPWGPAAWLWYYNTLYPTRKPVDFANYTARLKQNLAQRGRLEALQQLMFASKAESAARLEQVTQPVFILMGSKDPDFKDPAAEAQWAAGQLRAPYRIIEGAGHYPHVEMPEIAVPMITGFLKSKKLELNYAAAAG